MRPGTEYKEGRETEGNCMETALMRLTRINDQFILFTVLCWCIHSLITIMMLLFSLSKENQLPCCLI